VNIARAALLVVLVLAAGCATRQRPAPVFDARAPKPAAAKPAAAAPVPAPPATGSADFYIVRRGDTLYSIALEHGADYRELAQWNDLDDPTRIRVGQQLRMTPPEVERSVRIGPARIPGRVESRPLEAPAPTPPVSIPTGPTPTGPIPAAPAAVPKETVKLELGAAQLQFIWPAKGKVLAEFAEPRKKGIDIDGKPGDPIVAAAAGRVTYIGTGIPGMGKLVVIKHDNGFITVYAHNRDIMVKEQQAVTRGQKIAELGSTDSERPKLHFQIRKGAAAVDPLLYLPRS